MNLRQVIEHVDRVKPNAFDERDKTTWLNELEFTIQTDVFRITEGIRGHVWDSAWSGTGVGFPENCVMVVPGRMPVGIGGLLTIAGTATYPKNAVTAVPLAVEAGESETVIRFREGTFPEWNESEEEGEVSLSYDGGPEPMLAPEFWAKIYYSYLEARIALANGEMTEYANLLVVHNQFMNEYMAWYSRNYVDK